MGELAQKKSVCAGAKQEILATAHHCDRLGTSDLHVNWKETVH